MQNIQSKSGIRIIFGVLFGLLLVALAGYCLVYFVLMRLDQAGTYYHTAILTDLDNDGDQDIVVHDVRTESEFTAFGGPTFWINEGDGRFVAQRYNIEGGWASAPADVDRDGDADLLIFPGSYLRVVLNQGGMQKGIVGELKENNAVNAPETMAQFGSLVLGDLNTDGQIDGVVLGCCGRAFTLDSDEYIPNNSWVWINEWDPRGWLVDHSYPIPELTGFSIRAGGLGDLDNDGDLDLFAGVLAPFQGGKTSSGLVFLNDGLGNFSDSGQRLGDGEAYAVALGDLDGDGDLDALTGGPGLTVWFNQGGAQNGQPGIFAQAGKPIDAGEVRVLLLADLDGDGDQDALSAGSKKVILWWNDGAGRFSLSDRTFRYTERHAVAIGDLNNDNQPDIFMAEYDQTYQIWFNQGDGVFRKQPSP